MRGGDENVIFDPRPAKFKQAAGYQDGFRNKCINFRESVRKYLSSILFLFSENLPIQICHNLGKFHIIYFI